MDDVLLNASEEEVPRRMAHIIRHTRAPYRKLAVWMRSERPVISLEASRQLNLLIDRWEQHAGMQIAQDAVLLAEALHDEIPHYSDKVREEVHLAAVRMASWNLGGPATQEGAYLVAVERLIERSAGSPSQEIAAASDELLAQYLDNLSTREPQRPGIEPYDNLNQVALNTGLPWNQVGLPNLPRVSQQPMVEVPQSTEQVASPVAEALPANQRVSLGSQPLKLPPLVSSPRHIDPGPIMPEALPDYKSLTTLEVIWKLHAQSPRLGQHARQELENRRFSAADIELATRLSHPEIAQRLLVVRELPLMQREDRKTWLYYMTKDPDESVRYAAAAALITSSDPRLLRQLKAELTADPSPRIQSLIKR
ncbi:hypothetical protein DTL42_06840 [Bremerella cremea]|uniref:HEAT repeat domain-containing protein n=1 Tax=Bremerella cremea TaxID=1031537 RepID=A0A368KWM3_9BACT|nr:hypothetical protein DTL42_06840 [Bremerella cremea]